MLILSNLPGAVRTQQPAARAPHSAAETHGAAASSRRSSRQPVLLHLCYALAPFCFTNCISSPALGQEACLSAAQPPLLASEVQFLCLLHAWSFPLPAAGLRSDLTLPMLPASAQQGAAEEVKPSGSTSPTAWPCNNQTNRSAGTDPNAGKLR